jgi:monoamine oxidase
MQTIKSDVLIIGAGLSGLALAYYLKQKNVSVVIAEARDRIGGRILTKTNPDAASVELGATWISESHHLIKNLLSDLDLELFEQEMGDTAIYEPYSTSPHQLVKLPPSGALNYRVKNGTGQIIQRLTEKLAPEQLHLNQSIKFISFYKDEHALAQSDTHEFKASHIVSTLPPMHLAKTIDITPEFSESVKSIALKTHTWMGDSIKISLTYKNKFWQVGQLSGTIFSNVGPIQEMYDQSNFSNTKYALTGFLNGIYHGVGKNERLAIILKQLQKYYGPQVNDFLHYEELVWNKESFTSIASSEYILPHYNNGHKVYQEAFYNNRFFVAGTETSATNPGYMEGALDSALNTFKKLETLL